jgi:ubiquinone/menaquinone biosynthesis C-methylase UbiE
MTASKDPGKAGNPSIVPAKDHQVDVYERNRSAYDRIVLKFAKRNHVSLEGDLLGLAQKLVQHVGTGGRILDIGCGTGRDMSYFESQGIRTTGLDLSAGMLAFALSEVKGGLAQMNMCRMGIRDASFEGAWSCASLLHVPKKDAPIALREVRRILKPGGMFMLFLQEGTAESWNGGYVPGVRRFFARYQVGEMGSLLLHSGFDIQETDCSQGSNGRTWISFTCIAG